MAGDGDDPGGPSRAADDGDDVAGRDGGARPLGSDGAAGNSSVFSSLPPGIAASLERLSASQEGAAKPNNEQESGDAFTASNDDLFKEIRETATTLAALDPKAVREAMTALNAEGDLKQILARMKARILELEDEKRARLSKQNAALVEIRKRAANSQRPPGRVWGRQLADFLDQPGETGLLPAEERLLDAAMYGEECDVTKTMPVPRPQAEQVQKARQLLSEFPGLDDDQRAVIAKSDEAVLEWSQSTAPRGSLLRLKWRNGCCYSRDCVHPSGRENVIRAEFIRFLALGGDDDTPIREAGVRLIGALIVGELDLSGAKNVLPLWLMNCHFENAIVIRRANLAQLSLQGSQIPGLRGDGVIISGDVFLRHGFTARGEVRFAGAKIGGSLECADGTFENRTDDGEGIALSCDSADITGNVSLSGDFNAQGLVDFAGAKIGGDLFCSGGTFINRNKDKDGNYFGNSVALACNGADITGDVSLSGDFTAQGGVFFTGAKIGGGLECAGGTFVNRTDDGKAIALLCSNADITGNVSLSGDFTAQGLVAFAGAKIGGDLSCAGGTFINRNKDKDGNYFGNSVALACSNADITGNVLLSGDFAAQGLVVFAGAKIGGDLSCSGGTFENRTDDGEGIALACSNADITGNVRLSQIFNEKEEETGKFCAKGKVLFFGAKVGGDLQCVGGLIDNCVAAKTTEKTRERNPPAAMALNFQGARIKGTLWLGPAAGAGRKSPEIRGRVSFSGTYAHELIDHSDGWPGGKNGDLCDDKGNKLTGAIMLDGFTYDRFTGMGDYDADTRKKWLLRQSYAARCENFRPQPYEQLARVLRAMGHDNGARKIAKAKQAQQNLAGFWRAWSNLQKDWSAFRESRDSLWKPVASLRALLAASILTSLSWLFFGRLLGYGYGIKRLFAMFALAWLLGAFIYGVAAEKGLMVPRHPEVYTNTAITSDCAGKWLTCAALPKEHSVFEPYAYSADVLMPVVSLGLEDDWQPLYAQRAQPGLPDGSSLSLSLPVPFSSLSWTAPPWALRAFYWAQIITGWLLSGAMVAVLSGVMKQE